MVLRKVLEIDRGPDKKKAYWGSCRTARPVRTFQFSYMSILQILLPFNNHHLIGRILKTSLSITDAKTSESPMRSVCSVDYMVSYRAVGEVIVKGEVSEKPKHKALGMSSIWTELRQGISEKN